MREIGVFEAKTHLSEILDAVEAGESVTITKRGKPIAILSPASTKIEQRRAAAAELADIKNSIQKIVTTEEVVEMRDEGRKH